MAFGLLAFGQGEWNDWAAASFLLSFFLDRADGELARQSGKSSPWGHRYDLVTDALSNILIFLGIGIGLRDSQLGYGAIALGLLAGGGIVAMLWLMSKVESHGRHRSRRLFGHSEGSTRMTRWLSSRSPSG